MRIKYKIINTSLYTTCAGWSRHQKKVKEISNLVYTQVSHDNCSRSIHFEVKRSNARSRGQHVTDCLSVLPYISRKRKLANIQIIGHFPTALLCRGTTRMRSKCTKHDITIEVSPHEIHVAMLYIVRRSKCQGHERNISYILQMDGLIKLKSSGALVSAQVIALSPVSTKGRPPTLILAGSVIGGRGDYYRGRLDHLHVS